MNLKLPFKALTILTLVFILYTGCNRRPVKFIFMPPQAILQSKTQAVTEGATVSFEGLKIELLINKQDVTVAATPPLPGNKAYAFQVYMPTPIPLEEIADIRIRPMYGYNDAYMKGDEMSATCKYSLVPEPKGHFISKDQLISDFNISTDMPRDKYYIHITEPPSGSHKQQFVVEMITDNNGRLADTTVEFILTP